MDVPASGNGLGRIGRFIRRQYAPFLLRPLVKGVVVLAFTGIFVISVISMQHIQLGLGKSQSTVVIYTAAYLSFV